MLRITASVGAGNSELLAMSMSVESMPLWGRVPSLRARVDLAQHFPSPRLLLLPSPFLPFVWFHHSATVLRLLLTPLLLVGTGQLLDRFPRASVNVDREKFPHLTAVDFPPPDTGCLRNLVSRRGRGDGGAPRSPEPRCALMGSHSATDHDTGGKNEPTSRRGIRS